VKSLVISTVSAAVPRKIVQSVLYQFPLAVLVVALSTFLVSRRRKPHARKPIFGFCFWLIFVGTGSFFCPQSLSAAIAYVQANSAVPQTPQTAVNVTYVNAQGAGNLNVVSGGGPTTDAVGVAQAILPAELWSPATETWTTLAAMSAPRLYHSEALLLPDGRVLVHGGGRFNGVNEPTDQLSAEFFAPPYLFKGARPTVTSAPAQLSYGQIFTVQTPDAASIATVSLIRFGSVTPAFKMGQRLEMTFLHFREGRPLCRPILSPCVLLWLPEMISLDCTEGPFRRHCETMLISAAARLRGTAALQVAIDHDEQSRRFA
jgi:hypothetical protein